LAVVGVVKSWAGHDSREEEDVANVVENAGHSPDSVISLDFAKFRVRKSTVLNVPAEGSELHDQDHLSSCDVENRWIVDGLSVDVVHRHVAHKEDKADPWHVRGVDFRGDEVGTAGTDEYGPQAGPQVK
jgi:hypothetical protein